MLVLGISLLALVLPFLLLLVDRKIKVGKSIGTKIVSLAFFTLLIAATVYLYGTAVFESFQVDVRSFSKIKAFFSSRIFAMLIVAMLVLFVVVSAIHVVIVLIKSQRAVTKKTEQSSDLITVTYDIDVIPDNAVLSMETNNTERLEFKTLVFSYSSLGNKEVFAL